MELETNDGVLFKKMVVKLKLIKVESRRQDACDRGVWIEVRCFSFTLRFSMPACETKEIVSCFLKKEGYASRGLVKRKGQ